ncbi:translocation protein TolB [compost metagenome]
MNVKQLMMMVSCGTLMFSCSHTSVTKNILSSDFLAAQGSKQLTFLGDNERPRFSPDGERLIFSRSRNGHKQSQVYELNWKKNIERRVTYSDGDSFDPTYLNDDEIIYASTTDEIKESPILNRNFDKDNPPSDLYMSDLYGTNIIRMTRQPGYDAEAFYVDIPKRPFIIFSSNRGEIRGLYRMDFKTTQTNFLNVEKGKSKRSPAVTPNHKQLAWIETDLKSSEQKIVLASIGGKNPQILKENEGAYRDLSFGPEMPAKLYYSIVRKGDSKSQLEVYDVEQKCTRVIFKGSDSLYSPTVSVKGKLAFARQFQDKKQIYIADIPADLGSCLEASVPAKLEK